MMYPQKPYRPELRYTPASGSLDHLTVGRQSFQGRVMGRVVEIFFGLDKQLWRYVMPHDPYRWSVGQVTVASGPDVIPWIITHAASRVERIRGLSILHRMDLEECLHSPFSGFVSATNLYREYLSELRRLGVVGERPVEIEEPEPETTEAPDVLGALEAAASSKFPEETYATQETEQEGDDNLEEWSGGDL